MLCKGFYDDFAFAPIIPTKGLYFWTPTKGRAPRPLRLVRPPNN